MTEQFLVLSPGAPTPGESFARVVNTKPSLEWLQETVGGWVEHVELTPEVGLILNEEGKSEGLELNQAVEALLGVSQFLIPGDYISGTVIIIGPPKNGEMTGTPAAILEGARSAGWIE